ncbi:MAG: hypothetical protein ACRDBH_10675 [Bosea sp. (in: a-proteobacteria)]
MNALGHIASRPVQSDHIEAMKDEAFVTAFKAKVVTKVSDIFLVTTRSALMVLPIRTGLVIDAMLEAFADIVVRSMDLGLRNSSSPDDRALYLRRLADKITARADAIAPLPKKAVQ